MVKLSEEEVHKKITELDGWEHIDEHLIKSFKFKNFVEAVKFINKLVPIAEKMQHHPDVSLENYNELTVGLSTHDENGLTELDFKLAKEIDKIKKS